MAEPKKQGANGVAVQLPIKHYDALRRRNAD